MNKSIVSIALKGIALAMSVAVIVLHILGTLDASNAVNLLAIGLAALAFDALRNHE